MPGIASSNKYDGKPKMPRAQTHQTAGTPTYHSTPLMPHQNWRRSAPTSGVRAEIPTLPRHIEVRKKIEKSEIDPGGKMDSDFWVFDDFCRSNRNGISKR